MGGEETRAEQAPSPVPSPSIPLQLAICARALARAHGCLMGGAREDSLERIPALGQPVVLVAGGGARGGSDSDSGGSCQRKADGGNFHIRRAVPLRRLLRSLARSLVVVLFLASNAFVLRTSARPANVRSDRSPLCFTRKAARAAAISPDGKMTAADSPHRSRNLIRVMRVSQTFSCQNILIS